MPVLEEDDVFQQEGDGGALAQELEIFGGSLDDMPDPNPPPQQQRGPQALSVFLGPEGEAEARQFEGLDAAREDARYRDEAFVPTLMRRLPFIRSGFAFGNALQLDQANARIAQNQGTQADFDRVAAMERIQQIGQERTTGERIGNTMMELPAIAAEAMMAGRVLGQSMAPAQGASLATRAGLFAGQSAATAGLMGGWAPRMAENNQAHGRQAHDWRGFGPAFAHEAATMAVLGSLGKFGDTVGANTIGGFIQRGFTRVGLGMLEQQGLDLASSAVQNSVQNVFNYDLGLDSGYGLVGQLARGEGHEALATATEQALTFAVFAGMHEAGRTSAMREYSANLREMHRSGVPRAEAARQMETATSLLSTASAAEMGRNEARLLLDEIPAGPARRYAESMMNVLPEQGRPARRTGAGGEAAFLNQPRRQPSLSDLLGSTAGRQESPFLRQPPRQRSLSDMLGEGRPTPEREIPGHVDYPELPKPVANSFAEHFPDARVTSRLDNPALVSKTAGGTEVIFDPKKNSVHIDIGVNKQGVGESLAGETVSMFRNLGQFLGKMRDQGLNVEYRAIDYKKTAGKKAGQEASRAAIYDRLMRRSGFELVSAEKGEYTWKPKETAKLGTPKPQASEPAKPTPAKDKLHAVVRTEFGKPAQVLSWTTEANARKEAAKLGKAGGRATFHALPEDVVQKRGFKGVAHPSAAEATPAAPEPQKAPSPVPAAPTPPGPPQAPGRGIVPADPGTQRPGFMRNTPSSEASRTFQAAGLTPIEAHVMNMLHSQFRDVAPTHAQIAAMAETRRIAGKEYKGDGRATIQAAEKRAREKLRVYAESQGVEGARVPTAVESRAEAKVERVGDAKAEAEDLDGVTHGSLEKRQAEIDEAVSSGRFSPKQAAKMRRGIVRDAETLYNRVVDRHLKYIAEAKAAGATPEQMAELNNTFQEEAQRAQRSAGQGKEELRANQRSERTARETEGVGKRVRRRGDGERPSTPAETQASPAEVPANVPAQPEATLTVHHGTTHAFDRFDPKYAQQTGLGERGFFFTPVKELADAYQEATGQGAGPARTEGVRQKRTITLTVPKSALLDLTSPEAERLGKGGNIDAKIKAAGYDGFMTLGGDHVIYDPNKFMKSPNVPAQPEGFGRPVTEAERSVLPGGAQPGAEQRTPAQPHELAALANAEIDAWREGQSLPPIMSDARRADPVVWDRAMAELSQNPRAGEQLVDALLAKSRSTTAEENALLLHRTVSTRNERSRNVLQLVDAYQQRAKEGGRNAQSPETAAKIAQLEKAERDLAQMVDKADKAARVSGSEWGRAGRWRRQLLAEDFSLAGLLQKAVAAKGKPLTPEESVEIATLHKKLAEAEKKLEEAIAQGKVQPEGKGPGKGPGKGGGTGSDEGFAVDQARKPLTRVIDRLKNQNQPLAVKALRYGQEAFSIPKSIKASIDFPWFRQGMLMITHPLEMARAIKKSLQASISEQVAERAAYDVHHRQGAEVGEGAGLELSAREGKLSQREEQFLSNAVSLANMEQIAKTHPKTAAALKVITSPLRFSERGYITFLNEIRASRFDAHVNALAEKAPDGTMTISPDGAKVIANFVNVMTGRGAMGQTSEKAIGLLNATFFAPRWVVSRFQYLTGQPVWGAFGHSSPAARRMIAMEYGRQLAGLAAVIGLATAAGFKVVKDPRSSEFGYLQVGNTFIDLTGGLRRALVLMTQVATGKKVNQFGVPQNIRGDVPFGQDDTADVLWNFTRRSMAPVPSAAVNTAAGSDPMHTPTTPQAEAVGLFSPLIAKDVAATMRDLGVPAGTIVSLMTMAGFGTATHENTPPAPRTTSVQEQRVRQQITQLTNAIRNRRMVNGKMQQGPPLPAEARARLQREIDQLVRLLP